MSFKLLLISGHGANDPGACSSYGIERDETRKVVNRMFNLFKGYDVVVDVYPQNRNCYADVCNGNVQVNFANYDYVFEVHFNSASASAKGTEIFVTTAESGTAVEQTVVNKLASVGFVNRGVKRTDFAVINAAKRKGTSSALLEVCFISNAQDMSVYKNKFADVCNAIVSGIAQGFGIEKISGDKIPETSVEPKPAPPQSAQSYVVRIVNNAIYVLDGPSQNANIVDTVYKGQAFTIVEVKNGYGRLKSGAGWINLKYTSTVSGSQPASNNQFRVRIFNDAIYVLDGPSMYSNIVTTVYKNEVFTIVEVKNGYGRLKSGAGWIYLGYTTKI